jgi:citrate synthase
MSARFRRRTSLVNVDRTINVARSAETSESGRRWLNAEEAAARLGVRRETVYAYVSRGLLRSEAGPGPSRERRYRAADVDRLAARHQGRRDPAGAVRDALHWGEGLPVLDSAISTIEDDDLWYRGVPVGELVAGSTFDGVIVLLWAAEADVLTGPPLDPTPEIEPLRAAGAFCEAFQAVLALDAAHGVAAHDLRPEAVRRSGARILARLLATATGRPAGAARAAETLAAAWAPQVEAATALLDTALIVSADHELNVSAFAARCVASAGSTPQAAVSAGIGALGGVHAGRPDEWARELLDDAAARGAPLALAASVRRHGLLPGFAGLPVYPDGDPRATLLLDRIRVALPGALAVSDAVVAAARDELGVQPSADYARAALASVLDLPRGAELALFALGRTAGLVAHALEQYAADRLIRPRARYVGPRPA